MKMALQTLGVCGVVIMIGLAPHIRGFQPGAPDSRLTSALDADRDGILSASELRSSSSALKALDLNADGQLAGEEFGPPSGPEGRRGRGGPGGRDGAAGSASADELTETLMTFDRNGDGQLERAEVPERFQGLFDRADANKDAALTRDELKQSASKTVQEGDGGGRRGGEGREFEGRGRGRGRGFRDPLPSALDTDRDGALSTAEIGAAPEALKSLDANHDGQLTGDELRPTPPRGREGRR